MRTSSYATLQIENLDVHNILQQASQALESKGQVELNFVSKPPPAAFEKLLLQLEKNLPSQKWFLSERDSIIAGVLFNLNYSRPRRAVIEIANGCNLKCDFCWTHSPLLDTPPDAKWLRKTLEASLIRNYLDELADFGTVRLVEFCAIGDPLYHPEIWELIAYAKAKGFSLRLSTNGTLLFPTKWDKFCSSDPANELFMNISAGDRETYASIHNVSPQVFDQLMVNLKHIDADRKRQGHALSMRWINIVTDKNIGNIDQIVQSGIEAGADYFDFRYVWIHKEFQKNIGIAAATLDQHWSSLLKTGERIRETGLRSNYSDFLQSISKVEH